VSGPDRTAPPEPHPKDLALPALRERFAAEGWPRYRADQWAAWVYGRGATSYDAMTDWPAALRAELAERWPLEVLALDAVQTSADGTRKARLRTPDGHEIESVWIPEAERNTLCVSTQVGCPLACSFCATGAMGFTRNLRTSEIVDQVCRMQALVGAEARVTNVVFMGMGEPLLNRPAVEEAVRILIDPKGFGLAPRRVTVSTAGVVPQIEPLLEAVPVSLAVSLHAARDDVRDVLVPLNRRFDLDALLGTLRRCARITRRRPVFFEYTLIEGVNDAVEDARALAGRVRGLPCKVNLIPMNAHADSPHGPPSEAVMDRFMGELVRGGVTVTLRRNRGADIDAACGQLAARDAA
jgi:23S rRNA (adenine2503-C2)-methyltransferase